MKKISPTKNRSSRRACYKNRSLKVYVSKIDQLQYMRKAVDFFFQVNAFIWLIFKIRP